MSSPLALKVAELASHDVGQRETDGPNDSPRIRQYLRTTAAKYGSPYCISAICTWVNEAVCEFNQARTLNLRFSASCLSFWALNESLRFAKHLLRPDRLPCIGIEDHGNGHGHAYIVVGMDEDTGALQTIEANTSPKGSREGGGVYALNIRNVKDEKLLGFVAIR